MSLMLAIVAVVAISGLIYWLNVTAEPTQVQYTPPEDTASAEAQFDVPVVTLEQLRAEMSEYVNLELAMRNQIVNSLLGDQAFWVGPQDNPFLVKMDSAALAQVDSVTTGDTLTVRGTIHAMSDSVLNAWEEQGVIAGQGQRAVASFAEQFLTANQITPGSGAPASYGEAADTASSDTAGGSSGSGGSSGQSGSGNGG